MTSRGKSGDPGPGRAERRVLAAACLFLTALSLVYYFRDLRSRATAERFVREFSVDRRHPFATAAMRLEPSADLACAMAVDAAVRDDIPAASRQELLEAQRLMVIALTLRPGWPFHAYLLGQTARLLAEAAPRTSGSASDLWAVSLRAATEAVPDSDAIAEGRATAYLAMWTRLDPSQRGEAPAILQRAFLNPDCVAREFGAAVARLGTQRALTLLPDLPRPLRAATKALSSAGDIPSLTLLYERLLRADRRERAQDLRKIETRDRLGDIEGKRVECENWISQHPIREFDDPAGRAEVSRLLELWPNDRSGAWTSDPRADMASFFLAGREADVKGEALLRAVEALLGVPASVRARARLLAGDESGALDLAAQAESDSFEWTSFFVSLARLKLSQGSPEKAREALARVSPEAREDCDVLLTRRQVADALSDRSEFELARQKLEIARPGARRDSWSAGGTLLLCLDPVQTKGHVLQVGIQAPSPALATFGWDGGRAGIRLIPRGDEFMRFPLAGLVGRRSLSIRSLAGGPIQPIRASLEPVS